MYVRGSECWMNILDNSKNVLLKGWEERMDATHWVGGFDSKITLANTCRATRSIPESIQQPWEKGGSSKGGRSRALHTFAQPGKKNPEGKPVLNGPGKG